MAWIRNILPLAPALIGLAAAACSGQPITPSTEGTASPPPSPPASAPTVAAIPSPTVPPTAPPSATPVPDSPPGLIEGLDNDGLAQTAFEYTRRLAEDLGPRASATEQEKAAAEFLAAEFTAMGYQASLQPFTFKMLSPEDSFLTLEPAGAAESPEFQVNLLSGTASGQASGNLISVGLAMPDEIPDEGLAGKIALIQRGSITFRQKVNRVSQAGAVGAVIYNNVEGNFQGTLGRRAETGTISIPVVSISDEDGPKLLDMLSQGNIPAAVSVVRKELSSRNVVAEKPGPGKDVVVLGAHYDTVPEVPGANDNASGTAVLLTIAKQLADLELPFTVRFIPFGFEEVGLRGSRAYVDSLAPEEVARIAAMMNFDALATGSEIRILGTGRLTNLGVQLGQDLGIMLTRSSGMVGSSSDHATFDEAGIPEIMFTAPEFSRIHTADDTLEFVQPGLLGDSARLALAMLESPEFLTIQ